MPPSWVRFATIGFAFAAAAATAQTVTEMTGQTAGGAHYSIQVPDGWTPADGLVIWNHGFSLSPIGPVADLGPLAALQLSEGFAVAASSYSLPGWALFETVADLEGMVQAFEDAFGIPEEVFIYGASLGGAVTAQAIEQADLGNVVGALPICGALGGSRIWDGALDLRLLYDLICGDVPGAAIPGGPTGLPFPPDPSVNETSVGIAINICTGVLLPPPARSPEQADRLQQILDLTGIPESFLLTDMGFATFGMADLVHDPRKLNGGQGLGNLHVDYGDAGVNASIERVDIDQEARLRMVDHHTPTGYVGDVKIISIHTDKDGLVLVENESEYAASVPPGQLTTAVVVEDIPTHCGFNEAEVAAAWEALRAWVAGTPQPTPGALQATCEGLVLGGLAEGPCRIDPGFAVPDLDGRVRLRDVCVPGEESLCLGDGRFRLEATWRSFVDDTGVGHTVPQTPDTGIFYFFDPDNFELMAKVIDGRQNNGHFWVFFGALSNVEFDLTVTDTESGVAKTYHNPLGSFASIGDTEAF